MTFTAYRGAGKRMTDIDLPRIGHQIGVGEDEVHAILDVESAGKGFDSQGRVTILFEPHIFYKLLGNTSKRKAAVAAKLACPKARGLGYAVPSYQRLLAAIEIDETIALQSASWGLGQLMGFNHRMAGYPTVQAMIADFADSEAAQLNGMIRFIVASHLDDELRRHDWLGFARGYNGAGQMGYDIKIRDRFNHWLKIKDTPYKPGAVTASVAAGPAPTPTVDLSKPPTPVDVPKYDDIVKDGIDETAVQNSLKKLGYFEVGIVGDKAGGGTAGAITAFKIDRGMSGPAVADQALVDELGRALVAGWTRPITTKRSEATPETVRDKVPEVKASWRAKIAAKFTAWGAAILGVGTGAANQFPTVQGFIQPVQSYLSDVPGWQWLLLIALGAVGYYLINKKAEDAGIEAFQTGARR
jgi:hypothetical protein